MSLAAAERDASDFPGRLVVASDAEGCNGDEELVNASAALNEVSLRKMRVSARQFPSGKTRLRKWRAPGAVRLSAEPRREGPLDPTTPDPKMKA